MWSLSSWLRTKDGTVVDMQEPLLGSKGLNLQSHLCHPEKRLIRLMADQGHHDLSPTSSACGLSMCCSTCCHAIPTNMCTLLTACQMMLMQQCLFYGCRYQRLCTFIRDSPGAAMALYSHAHSY